MLRSFNIIFLKFVFFLISFALCTLHFALPSYAACTPPTDYSSCPAETQPDINLFIRGWEPTTGSHNLFYYQHPTDQAPKLNTLIEGNGNPNITSLYKIKPMPWDPPNFLNPPPGLSEFATLVGFKTTPGQNILVPKYFNTIDGFNQVTILYATTTQATLNYTIDDSPAGGYLIHLINFNVNPGLVECYNKYNTQGRKELPAMTAGEIIGQASGNEILVSIRDRGSFMDPRWENDWWLSKTPTSGHAFSCKTSKMIAIPGSNGGKAFNPKRTVTTGNTIDSTSDTVLLNQSASLALGEIGPRTITRGGWFQEFQDLEMPFAEELTKYLAGPFVRDIGANSNLKIKQFQVNGKIEDAGVLSKLTPDEIQDDMRHLYRWKCGNSYGDPNGYYCSSITIGVAPDCPDASSNECLFSDGTEYPKGPRKPRYSDFQNTEEGQKAFQNALQIWNSNANNVRKWHEIPLISNPKTRVEGAVYMNACPPPVSANGGETTVKTITPWVSALNEVSGFLNQLLVPAGAGSQVSLPSSVSSANPPVLLASKNIPNENPSVALHEGGLAQTSPPSFYIDAEGSHSGSQLSVSVKFFGDRCDGDINLDLNGNHVFGTNRWNLGMNNPYVVPPQYTGSPFSLSPGNTIALTYTGKVVNSQCSNGSSSITCNFAVDASGKVSSNCGTTVLPPPPSPTCAPPNSPDARSDPNASEIETDKIDHALLREPHEVLQQRCELDPISGYTCFGNNDVTFNDPVWAVVRFPFLNSIYENLSGEKGIFKLFKPTEQESENWDQEGESKITYCFAKHGASSMIDGTLQIDKTRFNKPPAKCENNTYTKGLSVYPKYIGGVENAKDWVVNCILQPNSKCL